MGAFAGVGVGGDPDHGEVVEQFFLQFWFGVQHAALLVDQQVQDGGTGRYALAETALQHQRLEFGLASADQGADALAEKGVG